MQGSLVKIIGLINLILFTGIVLFEALSPFGFGVTYGTVVEINPNPITCFGDTKIAKVNLNINEGLNLPITISHFADRLEKNQKHLFFYWGRKTEIEHPLEVLEPLPGETERTNVGEYLPNVIIDLFSVDSTYSMLFTFYSFLKWFLLISGIMIIYVSRKIFLK